MSSSNLSARVLDALLWAAVIATLTFAFWPRDSGPDEGAVAPAFELPLVAGSTPSRDLISSKSVSNNLVSSNEASGNEASGNEASGKRTFVQDGRRDRPLLIEAFASWCGACRRDRHVLAAVHEASLRGGLDVVAISLDDDAASAKDAARTWPIPVPVLHDERGQFARKYQVDVLPTYILIDTEGRVSHVRSGTAGASDLRTWLNQVARE